ncbi:hypothetical protein [Micromonospora sp. NPDC050495]|uniref:hypothetical protein n=1 Tax=Micromonospora sp. NPDC050495 TaxID=3154936 RepID=UPI0033E81A26
MGMFRKLAQVALVGGALTLVVACGSDGGPAASGPVRVPAAGDEAADAGTGADGDECGRLPANEVAEVIGPNDGGQHDYALGGCIWTASSGPKDGIVEAVSATVLPKEQYEAVADAGSPVSGSADGATYNDIHGELWFPCRSGDFCGIKVSISDPDKRKDAALRLGKVLQGKV